MKTLLTGISFTVLGIILSSYLNAVHHNLYGVRYEACKAKLIAENNYKTQEQAFVCVTDSVAMKVLGTFLFSDGSVLQ